MDTSHKARKERNMAKLEFGTRMKILRMVRGLTQVGLGELTDIPANYISYMECGKVYPSEELEATIRAALGWSDREEKAFALLEGTNCPDMDAGEEGDCGGEE